MTGQSTPDFGLIRPINLMTHSSLGSNFLFRDYSSQGENYIQLDDVIMLYFFLVLLYLNKILDTKIIVLLHVF